MIDAHIHLDWYKLEEQEIILEDLEKGTIDGVVAVSSDLISCKNVWKLHKKCPYVHPSFGWHPEQPLPSEAELDSIERMIRRHHDAIVAIGEVGLPYYLKREKRSLDVKPYVAVLERFIRLAKELDLPIVLHAIYEDAEIVCDLLEEHQVEKAHFHWFKGAEQTVNRMIRSGYMISVTPDCLYEEEILQLVEQYPLELIMVETDGPWQFEGPFSGQMTHPDMMLESVKKIASVKGISLEEAEEQMETNTKSFYHIK
ncbi:TatD DNase family protein [Gracilibacillus ureilyticus]|uniref:TatD DNase family protein n=1 Tax=Gracilibacillus ureilyticus TaxID=531814 RepID=A0A1H9P631_9BACI|nr:TatD family hydrolase [Gracilibacillus ureilyticus]SER43551.1 TatD DNase family protein [Gracilibacillus ureilyticus]